MRSSPCLMLSRVDGKLLCIYLPFNCHTLEIIFSCYLLPFILGGGLKGEKKYLTIPFLAIFAYLSVSVTGHPHDEKHFLAAKPEKVVSIKTLGPWSPQVPMWPYDITEERGISV